MESLGLRSLTKETIATAGKSITGDGTPVSPLQLVNDEINPGNSEYYGTDAAGVKGFYPITGGGGTPSDIPAVPLGPVASPGFSTEVSRYDHVHPFPAATSLGAVPETRSIIAGTGLSGGGDLSTNRTLSVSFITTVLPLGNTGVPGGTADITVSSALTTQRIIAVDADADDMDALILSASCPVDGTVRLNYIAYPGPVAGDRNILLSIG